MSIFSGIINEYPNLSVDNFNPLVSTYLLSHLHLDHLNGIENILLTNETKIYTSLVTSKLIAGRHSEFKHIIPFVIGLQNEKSYTIEIKNHLSTKTSKDNEYITIILIPSGHCLGSVMFLISGKKGQVLYTGDFRFPIGYGLGMMKKFKISSLDSVYFDTTFMNKSCIYIPSREDSLNIILKIIEDFLLQDPENIIFVDYKVRYTLDMLYHLIYLKFNIKVHIDWKYQAQLSALDESISSCMDPSNINSRIHACYMGSDNPENFCKSILKSKKLNKKLLTIIPSTIWWMERNLLSKTFLHYIDKFTIRVCYSHHSSFSEAMDFITAISPKTIYDCVSKSNFTLKQIKKLFC